MNFNVRTIGGEYQEMTVDAIETGTLDKKEAIRLAQQMVSAAEDLLYGVGLRGNSDACGTIVEDLTDYL
jgi:hypothetical protein